MSKNEFIEFIKTKAFLGAERKAQLTENAAWMTANERSLLVKQITEAGNTIEQNNQSMLESLKRIEAALHQFKKEELPKLARMEETMEQESESQQANKLLNNL